MTIDNQLLADLLESNSRQIQLMNRLIANLKDDGERWVSTVVASRETGIDTSRIRYLAREGRIEARKRGPRLYEVRLGDLDQYK